MNFLPVETAQTEKTLPVTPSSASGSGGEWKGFMQSSLKLME